MLQILYILPLTATSAVALNEHRRFLFLFSFTTNCVNIHFVGFKAQTLAKNQFSSEVIFLTQLGYSSGSQTVVRVPLVAREGFSGGTRAAFLSYSKSFVNSFLCYNSFVCYANVANSFICYINLKCI